MPWDYAAAGLILEEAGGAVCTLDRGAPSLTQPSLLIAGNNKANCDRVLDIVRKHLPALPY
jgi:fructose-1,6-bisphosphatase/inositol monophosphatase family enzyme